MNKVKRIVASLVATATVGAVSLSASAYSTNYFNFNIPYEGYNWSVEAKKEDGFDSDAVLHPSDGTVSSNIPIFVTVYSKQQRNNAYRGSSTATMKSNSNAVTIKYTDSSLVHQGGYYYLLGETGAYSSSANGKWNP